MENGLREVKPWETDSIRRTVDSGLGKVKSGVYSTYIQYVEGGKWDCGQQTWELDQLDQTLKLR